MRLTRGEGWWLIRRRLGKGAAEFAGSLRISEDRLRSWERDRAPALMPGGPGLKGPLTHGEFSRICRRRASMTLPGLAVLYGRTRHTLMKMERDGTRTAPELAGYWKLRGIPRPRGPAPVRIPGP